MKKAYTELPYRAASIAYIGKKDSALEHIDVSRLPNEVMFGQPLPVILSRHNDIIIFGDSIDGKVSGLYTDPMPGFLADIVYANDQRTLCLDNSSDPRKYLGKLAGKIPKEGNTIVDLVAWPELGYVIDKNDWRRLKEEFPRVFIVS